MQVACARCGMDITDFLGSLCPACLVEESRMTGQEKADEIRANAALRNADADTKIPYSPGGLTQLIAQSKGRARARGPFRSKCEFCSDYYKGPKEDHFEN